MAAPVSPLPRPCGRDPGTLAVVAATLQDVSGGRPILLLGAGAGAGTAYAIEQEALGRGALAAAERRREVERTIAMVRQVWSGVVPPAARFLRPDPAPPILVGAFGPRMADLTGRVGDGICVPAASTPAELVATARRAYALSGRDPGQFPVSVSFSSMPKSAQPWVELGVDRLIVYVARPFGEGVAQLEEHVREWRIGTSRRQ